MRGCEREVASARTRVSLSLPPPCCSPKRAAVESGHARMRTVDPCDPLPATRQATHPGNAATPPEGYKPRPRTHPQAIRTLIFDVGA
jgi:hypothetical protein